MLIFYGHSAKLRKNGKYNFNSPQASGFHFRMLTFNSWIFYENENPAGTLIFQLSRRHRGFHFRLLTFDS